MLKIAYDVVGHEALEDYSNRHSPKTFTQPQLFAYLVLKAFFQTDYRGIEQMLTDLPDLCKVIGLEKVPHFSTLQKSEKRLLGAMETVAFLKNYLNLKPSRKLYSISNLY